MKIIAKGAGGFAGMAEHYDVDTAVIPNGPAIEALLRDVDFFATEPPPTVGADIPHWEVTIDDGKRRQTIAFAEDGSAETVHLQALISKLRASA